MRFGKYIRTAVCSRIMQKVQRLAVSILLHQYSMLEVPVIIRMYTTFVFDSYQKKIIKHIKLSLIAMYIFRVEF